MAKGKRSEQDNAINQALPRCLPHLLPILFPQFADLAAFSPEEAKTTFRATIRRELDSVFLFHAKSSIVLHVEIQLNDIKHFSERNLLYYSLIKNRFPEKKIIQYVVYTGKRHPNHVGKELPLENGGKYAYKVVHLAALSLQDFQQVNDILTYAFAVATLKSKEDVEAFTVKFAEISNLVSGQDVNDAMIVLESLIPEDIYKTLNDMIKEKTKPTSKLWDYMIKEGMEKGIEQGKVEGTRKKAIETAQKCLQKGFSIELIAEITGLSEQEVADIAQN
jgi:predicted transposase/invertase (TIGR01784 family)